MFDNLFTKTVPVPITNQDIIRLSKEHFKGEEFISSTKGLESNIEFYDDTIIRSKKMESLKFTNYVKNSPNQSDLKGIIIKLVENPSFIQDDVSVVDFNQKVLNCIKLYISDFSDEELVFKSNLKYQSGKHDSRQPVRIFSKVDRIPTDDGHKTILRIVLIDPFHLVIPSKHNGFSKEQMEDKNFRENKDNDYCMR